MTQLEKLKKEFNNQQWVILWANLGLWTVESFSANNFFESDYYAGTSVFWPFESGFKTSWSFEEWLVFAVGPFVVVYFLNRGKN